MTDSLYRLVEILGTSKTVKSASLLNPKLHFLWGLQQISSYDLLIESTTLTQQFPIQLRMLFEGFPAVCPEVIVDQ